MPRTHPAYIMGNKCCRSDGHVSVDSFANDQHAALAIQEQRHSKVRKVAKTTGSLSEQPASFESSSIVEVSSDIEAVNIWREHRSFNKSREEEVSIESSPASDPETPTPMPTPMHETEIESDVDSVTRDQYSIACKLLHKSMMQKKDKLTGTEREFLESLLKIPNDDTVSSVSYDQFAAIEHATQTLVTDPLFNESPVKSAYNERIHSDMDIEQFVPTNQLDTRNRSAESVEILRELEEEEAILYLATPPSTPVRIEETNGSEETVEMSLLYSQDNILHYDCDEEMPERAQIDLGPSIKRLRSAQDIFGPYMESNSMPLITTPNDQTGPYQHKSSFLTTTAPNLVEKDDDDDAYSPYDILGAQMSSRRILTPALIEALRGFLPFVISEENFWLKFTLEKDGDSLSNLLHTIRGSKYTFFAIRSGNRIFGSFTGAKWRKHKEWYGTGEAFLWRVEDSLKVYPYTGSDTLVQFCTNQMVAVGGGDWKEGESSPYMTGNRQPHGIGLLIDADLQGGESSSCATFCNPTLCGDVQEFTIDDLEVWTLTPCHNIAEAEKLELQKLFVEKHRKK